MPLSAEVLELLAKVGGPLKALAQDPSTFLFGRHDLKTPGNLLDTQSIMDRWSTPDRPLQLDTYPSDKPSAKISLPGLDSGYESAAPNMALDGNSPLYDQGWTTHTPHTVDIEASNAGARGAKGKAAAMQMYPAAWDYIKGQQAIDPSRSLLADNVTRKASALMSYIMRGRDASHVLPSSEMMRDVHTTGIPDFMEAMQQMYGVGDADARRFGPRFPDPSMGESRGTDIYKMWGRMTPDQQLGFLAMGERGKVAGRFHDQGLGNVFENNQWSLDNPQFFDTVSRAVSPADREYLTHSSKVGPATIKRSLMTDWIYRKVLRGGDPTAELMEGTPAFRQRTAYADGGLVAHRKGRKANWIDHLWEPDYNAPSVYSLPPAPEGAATPLDDEPVVQPRQDQEPVGIPMQGPMEPRSQVEDKLRMAYPPNPEVEPQYSPFEKMFNDPVAKPAPMRSRVQNMVDTIMGVGR